jgi:hypothetical protein
LGELHSGFHIIRKRHTIRKSFWSPLECKLGGESSLSCLDELLTVQLFTHLSAWSGADKTRARCLSEGHRFHYDTKVKAKTPRSQNPFHMSRLLPSCLSRSTTRMFEMPSRPHTHTPWVEGSRESKEREKTFSSYRFVFTFRRLFFPLFRKRQPAT